MHLLAFKGFPVQELFDNDVINIVINEEEMTLGTAWDHGFLKYHAALLTTSGTVIKDVKRRTWVTCKNFENMYGNVYKTMVEADVAEELEDAIQHNAGPPTKYKLTRPKYIELLKKGVGIL